MWLIPICLLDRRKWHWENEKILYPNESEITRNIFANINFLLIRVQMSVVYFHAAIGKLNVPEWINGSALYYWIRHPSFGMSTVAVDGLSFILRNRFLLFVTNWLVLILELLLFTGLLLDAKYYKKLFFLGVLFHFLIIIVHGLVSFFFAMTGGLILYFLVDYCLVYNNSLIFNKVNSGA